MTTAAAFSPGRPEPRPDASSAAFFEGLKQRQLLVQSCSDCSQRQLGRLRCLACNSQRLEWIAASGHGVLKSFAIVHANGNPHFNSGDPYNIAIVELSEGPQIYTNVVQAEPAELRIGMPVSVYYSTLESGAVAPLFQPTESQEKLP